MRQILDGETLDGDVEIGYWTGIHLLGEEPPEKYRERWRKWRKDDISDDRFETENIRQWNATVEKSEFETAEKFLEWYNESFLNLRQDSDQLIELLREQGYVIGLISHTSTSLCLHASEKLGTDFVVPTWSFTFDQERFSRTEKEKYGDQKSHIIDDIHQIEFEQVTFFGNGQNDVEIAEEADQGFLVENRDKVNYSDVNAFTASFKQIIEEQRKEVNP